MKMIQKIIEGYYTHFFWKHALKTEINTGYGCHTRYKM